MQIACNSLSYTLFYSVLLCLYLLVSFDLLKATIRKVTKNTVVITGGSSVWLLNYTDNNLYVELNGFMPIYGKINKRWTFPSNCPQESMIQAIENYLTWQLNKFTEMTAKYNEHNEMI